MNYKKKKLAIKKINKELLEGLYLTHGLSAKKIADLQNCSPTTIVGLLKEFGIKKDNFAEKLIKFKKLYEEKKSKEEIIEALNLKNDFYYYKLRAQAGISKKYSVIDNLLPEIDNIRKLVESGSMAQSIASLYNISPSTMFYFLKKNGIKIIKNKKLTDENLLEAEKLLKSGMRRADIAKKYHVSYSNLQQRLVSCSHLQQKLGLKKANNTFITSDHLKKLSKVHSLRNKGLSILDISQKFQIPDSPLLKYLKKIESNQHAN